MDENLGLEVHVVALHLEGHEVLDGIEPAARPLHAREDACERQHRKRHILILRASRSESSTHLMEKCPQTDAIGVRHGGLTTERGPHELHEVPTVDLNVAVME